MLGGAGPTGGNFLLQAFAAAGQYLGQPWMRLQTTPSYENGVHARKDYRPLIVFALEHRRLFFAGLRVLIC